MAGDGQVTLGNAIIMKNTAKKVRRLYNGKVVAGFAGAVADAFTLYDIFETQLESFDGNLRRASVETAKKWRSDRALQKLEAMLIVMDQTGILLVSGSGEVIEPDDGILAIGSGGNYALSAGRALKKYSGEHMTAAEIAKASLEIAGDLCVYTNHNIILEEI